MSHIADLTRSLAAALASDPRTLALKQARQALDGSPADQTLQQRYHDARERYEDLEAAGRAIEPDLKRELSRLEDEVRRSPVLRALLMAHGEFAQMMDEVSGTLSEAVDQALTPSRIVMP
jgi:cell fate (sporulation/competence/biofilm development) regulator YlbF (YheA/YmcA/DUF963 family)